MGERETMAMGPSSEECCGGSPLCNRNVPRRSILAEKGYICWGCDYRTDSLYDLGDHVAAAHADAEDGS